MAKRVFELGISALVAGVLGNAAPARATAINDLFVFGDSYSDTGAYFPLTNGSTAVGYLAQDLGINLVTPQTAIPGNNGVNFAESGARVAVGPTPPATHPLSFTQQVGEFQDYVNRGAVNFNPNSTLFMLLGGLNDHTTSQTTISAATTAQVSTLYSLGARLFDIALVPSLVPAFADSAANVNPVFSSLVPQLQAQFPGATIRLSNWGPDYDNILSNPSAYGITNTIDSCQSFQTRAVCATPDQYFYYVIVHPSAASHRIVGAELVAEANAIPEPVSATLVGTGLIGLLLSDYRRRRPDRLMINAGAKRATRIALPEDDRGKRPALTGRKRSAIPWTRAVAS